MKTDRRITRTRELLQSALIELVRAGEYDSITVQDIVDRANLGRTTFYLHYQSKDDLFISCHETIASEFHFGPLHPLSREEILSAEPPPEMILAYRHLEGVRGQLNSILRGKDSILILRRMREWRVHTIDACLHKAFPEATANNSFDLLVNYLAGAQTALMQWWLEKPRDCTAELVAQMLHRMQRAAICDAFRIKGDE